MNATKTILDWKNVVWLSLVSYALYTTLWLVIDDEIWHAPGQFSVTEMAVDFCMCVLFVGFSLLYSRTILRILPMRNRPYVRLLLMVCILFLLNNAMAYAMTVLCDAIWGDGSDELFRMQGIYTYGMTATFSCIYSNAFYLETYMHNRERETAAGNCAAQGAGGGVAVAARCAEIADRHPFHVQQFQHSG